MDAAPHGDCSSKIRVGASNSARRPDRADTNPNSEPQVLHTAPRVERPAGERARRARRLRPRAATPGCCSAQRTHLRARARSRLVDGMTVLPCCEPVFRTCSARSTQPNLECQHAMSSVCTVAVAGTTPAKRAARVVLPHELRPSMAMTRGRSGAILRVWIANRSTRWTIRSIRQGPAAGSSEGRWSHATTEPATSLRPGTSARPRSSPHV